MRLHAQSTISVSPHIAVTSFLEVTKVSRTSYQNPKVKERPTARGTEFYIRYRVAAIEMKDGRPVKVKKEKHQGLGLKSETTLAQAKRAASEIMQKVNGQGDTMQSHIPFESFIEIYMQEHYRRLKPPTQKTYTARINRWVLPALRGKKLYQITPFDITQMLGEMERQMICKNTRKVVRAITHTIFKEARKWGYLERGAQNPADDAEVGRSRGNAVVKWTPTMEEAVQIIESVSAEAGLLLWCLIWTGMRISEACGLRCCNVDLAQGVIYVRERVVNGESDDPKSDNGKRSLPLGTFAAQLAPLMARPEDFLFRKNGHGISECTYGPAIRKATVRLGMRHKGNMFHAFRRLHSNLMKSLTPWDLQRQMGHADITTTQLYVGDDLKARRDALSEAQSKVVPIRRQA